ncbi:MAG: radical SAM family heme chaperone HemW [Chloroflexi bacterium]|nr:radical SAM family heme chaperone HemW [Chloroflexota bacterium]
MDNRVNPIGLYVHIPFCRAKCAYCDFNSYAGRDELFTPYIQALERELAWRLAQWPGVVADTVYIGGGTPTLLPPELLEWLLERVCDDLCLPQDAEITIEANPGTVSETSLRALRAVGVNRLSLGVQSFDDKMLRLLGRIHDSAEAKKAIGLARAAGFDNLNLDLMFALPGQTMSTWIATLNTALALCPEHLSLYSLSLEEGTPLAIQVSTDALPPPDDDLAADMYLLAEDCLSTAGYYHYEISNWAASATTICNSEESTGSAFHVCRHNIKYWTLAPYWGLGAGAHSWYGGERTANVCDPQEYVARILAGGSPVATREIIDVEEEMAEFMFLGLRLIDGVRVSDFVRRFGMSWTDRYGAQIADLMALGLIIADGETVRLSRRGRLLGNQVFERFLPPDRICERV